MNKLNAGTIYNSGTSSEASETQSVEENQQSDSVTPSGTNTPPIQNSGSRIPKSLKRMKESGLDKDAEPKRPPWRAVSISTLPKPDKNALLRAKLLDASRRLRVTKIAVGVQTDIVPTKLMKEVNLGAQTDLILYKEVGVLTDGSYNKQRDGSGEYVLTYSVPLMTDTIETANVATQTLVPRLPEDAFLEACKKYTGSYDPKLLQQCSETEKKLLKQLEKIRKNIIPVVDKFDEGVSKEKSNDNDSPTDTDNTDNTNDAIKSVGSKMSYERNRTSPYTNFHSNFLKPTHLSWYFEYDNEYSCENKFHPYTITANKPWSSFTPVSFSSSYGINLNLLLIAVDELIQESNRLADIVDEISKKRNQATTTHMQDLKQKVKEYKPIIYDPPSKYWLPLIEEQEKVLAELKK